MFRLCTVSVPALDDCVDEGKEVMRQKLSNPKGAYLRGVHAKARGIITNHDPLPGAWLSRFGRTVAGPLGPLRGPAAADSPATKRSRAGGRCRRNEDVPGDPRRVRLPDGRRGAVLPDRVRGRWRLGGDGQGRDPRVPVAAGFPGRGLATATGMPGLSVSGSHRMPFGKDNPDLLAFDEMRGTCRTARISLAVW